MIFLVKSRSARISDNISVSLISVSIHLIIFSSNRARWMFLVKVQIKYLDSSWNNLKQGFLKLFPFPQIWIQVHFSRQITKRSLFALNSNPVFSIHFWFACGMMLYKKVSLSPFPLGRKIWKSRSFNGGKSRVEMHAKTQIGFPTHTVILEYLNLKK